VTSRSLIIKAKVRAINYLQTVLASRPMPSDKTVIWLAPALRLALSKQGVHTMGDLAAFISRRGRHWHRGVEKLGPGRAARILAWLQEHQTSIGVIDLTGPQWSPKPQMRSRIAPLQATSTTTVVLVEDVTTGIHAPSPALPEKRMGIAPFECLHVPAHLDGSVGLFRSQTPNHYGARNDYEAVRIWLGTFLNAGKLRTFDAYRREIERFYLWCLLEARVPLSSVSLSHAMGYQAFLRSIPRTYITTRRLTRDDPNWRPWRGQLTPRNQAYALGIVSQFYNDAMRNAYVTGNPFASLKSPNAGRRVMDTTRSLSTQDLQWVRECLDALEDSNKSDLWAAIDRRTKLILHLALSTGMRLEEIATTTLLSARRTIVDGIEQDDEWLLEVCGKGKNTRYLPISGSIYQMIKAHHGDAAARLALSGGSAARRLQMFRERPPLICALRSPVGHETDLINDEALMSADNLALGRAGLYRTLKTFFRRESRQQVKKLEIKARGLKKKTIAALAKGDHKQAKTLEDEETSVIREIKSLERRENISTHWLRHTFAKAILAANPSDSGLKLTQQLLGHASINTTQLYITQDESEKIRAVRRINPLGL
jgi:site-specific recombinase XerD